MGALGAANDNAPVDGPPTGQMPLRQRTSPRKRNNAFMPPKPPRTPQPANSPLKKRRLDQAGRTPNGNLLSSPLGLRGDASPYPTKSQGPNVSTCRLSPMCTRMVSEEKH